MWESSLYIYLEKANDNVDRYELWKLLHEYRVEDWLLNMIMVLYTESKAGVGVNRMLRKWFDVEKEVRQCVIPFVI